MNQDEFRAITSQHNTEVIYTELKEDEHREKPFQRSKKLKGTFFSFNYKDWELPTNSKIRYVRKETNSYRQQLEMSSGRKKEGATAFADPRQIVEIVPVNHPC